MFSRVDGARSALVLAFCALSLGAQAAVLDKFNPADYAKPTECPQHYGPDPVNGVCQAKKDEIKALDDKTCKGAGLKFNATSGCVAEAAAQNADCKKIPGYASMVSGAGDKAACSYERTIPVSATGDYIGDCFTIVAVPPGTNLEKGKSYFVSGQKNLDDEDRDLILVSGDYQLLPSSDQWFPSLCHATGGPQHQITASKLIEAGASRRGYAYGFLTMPYKYFPSEKSFLVNVPIGGYLGWRYGQAGSGTTAAFALTLSTVKANTVDPKLLDAAGKPTVTGSADVAALSGAFGLMFDILKSPRGKPFKAGVFIGRDVVSKDPTVDYRFNRKNWIAVPIGYDFTDN